MADKVMSHLRDYYVTIEDHFRALTGNPRYMASPREWELIESWENAGIPLEVCLRGIRLAVRDSKGRARTLSYCDYAVMGLATRLQAGTKSCACGERYDPLRAGWEGADKMCLKCSQLTSQ